jgi:hypothetical protein
MAALGTSAIILRSVGSNHHLDPAQLRLNQSVLATLRRHDTEPHGFCPHWVAGSSREAPVTAALDAAAKTVAVVFPKDAVQAWTAEHAAPIGSAIEGRFTSVALDAKGERLATGGDSTVQVWDIASGQAIGDLATNTPRRLSATEWRAAER